MNLKKQTELKINEYEGYSKNNKSKILTAINEINYGKMGIGLAGLSVCIPYMFPSISLEQIIATLPNISNNLLSLGLMGISGITACGCMDILAEMLNNKKLDINKENDNKEDSFILNSNKQLLEYSISKDEI